MNDSLLVAAPLMIAAIVMAVRFVGCGLAGSTGTGVEVSVTGDLSGEGSLSGTVPGNSSTPANEVTAGGYTRRSPVTFTLPSGAYPFMILCKDNGDMIDYCKISNVVLNTDGEIVVIPTYTQT